MMSSLRGKRLGNYELLEEIGRGGMAVVYRAHQSSLNRHVAIKVLPPHLTFDPEFVARFQREARAAARLRHPNIVVIHDVAEQDGFHYIVMELLQGQTLRELVERQGALPPGRVSHIVEQVASALDYAHQQGFVHRDIKPSNIFVGPGDHVTLTDFGIAKATSESQQLTRTGMLMGTPEYMSPEQAAGAPVDHRTDLYALGVVLYEMLTGRVPFHGTTPHATLHAVIYEPPPGPRQMNPKLSPAAEKVILTALAKRPEERYPSGTRLAAAFRDSLAPAAVRPGATARDRRSPLVWILGGIAAVLACVLVILLLLVGGAGREQARTSTTTEVVALVSATPALSHATPVLEPTAPMPAEPPAPPATTLPPTGIVVPATPTLAPATDVPPPTASSAPPTAAPAGPRFGRLAFTSKRDGNPEIYLLDLAQDRLRRLTQNRGNDWLPDWSPDGQQIAFTSNRREGSYDLWAMDANGGGLRPMVATDAWDDYARWAPDGRRLALSTTATTAGAPNSEIFVRRADGNLLRTTETTAEDQWPDWSPDGRIVFSEGFKGTGEWDLIVMNDDGSNRQVWLGGPACDVQPTWSPDGAWIAFLRIPADTNGNGLVDEEDGGDMWVGRASGGDLRQLTSGVWASIPAWSPDGQWIAFGLWTDANGNGRTDTEDGSDVWAVPLGGGDRIPLVQSPDWDGEPSWAW